MEFNSTKCIKQQIFEYTISFFYLKKSFIFILYIIECLTCLKNERPTKTRTENWKRRREEKSVTKRKKYLLPWKPDTKKSCESGRPDHLDP